MILRKIQRLVMIAVLICVTIKPAYSICEVSINGFDKAVDGVEQSTAVIECAKNEESNKFIPLSRIKSDCCLNNIEQPHILPQVSTALKGKSVSLLSTDAILPPKDTVFVKTDSLRTFADTTRLNQLTDTIIRNTQKKPLLKPQFIPDPKRALWLSLVLPGAGQIYNRKYWKLPIIYGGFLGCAYALMWNQQMYHDYSQAYLDIMDDDPNTHSYTEMLPPRYDITGREEQFQNLFKRKKDFYRRYRDLSAFCFIGVYLISVIDAYVDAQLSVFDISPELTMHVEPAVINSQNALGKRGNTAYGVGCSLNF